MNLICIQSSQSSYNRARAVKLMGPPWTLLACPCWHIFFHLTAHPSFIPPTFRFPHPINKPQTKVHELEPQTIFFFFFISATIWRPRNISFILIFIFVFFIFSYSWIFLEMLRENCKYANISASYFSRKMLSVKMYISPVCFNAVSF